MSYDAMVQTINFPKTCDAYVAAWGAYNAARKDDEPTQSPTWKPVYTSRTDYSGWKSELRHSYWHNIMESCADVVQLNFLRAITVAGVATYRWTDLFYRFNAGTGGWSRIKRNWLADGTMPSVLHLFLQVVQESGYVTNYPATYPEWLVPYGFTQQEYIEDLQEYWHNVADVYFELWPGTRFGLDTPEIAAIRRIGREARQEIEALSDMTYGYLPFEDFAGGDEYNENEE